MKKKHLSRADAAICDNQHRPHYHLIKIILTVLTLGS